jgi:hypothetical protein
VTVHATGPSIEGAKSAALKMELEIERKASERSRSKGQVYDSAGYSTAGCCRPGAGLSWRVSDKVRKCDSTDLCRPAP